MRLSVSDYELGLLLVSTVRCALGRHNPSPSTVAELVRNYGRAIPLADLLVIETEIGRAVEDHEMRRTSLGDACDVAVWGGALSWIRAG